MRRQRTAKKKIWRYASPNSHLYGGIGELPTNSKQKCQRPWTIRWSAGYYNHKSERNKSQHELGSTSLYSMLQRKLPQSMLASYHQWVFDNNVTQSVVTLRKWVIQELEFLTVASETVHGVTGRVSDAQTTPPRPGQRYTRTFFGRKGYNCAKKTQCCQVCGADHRIWTRLAFKQKRISEKWDIAKRCQLCFRCLTGGQISAKLVPEAVIVAWIDVTSCITDCCIERHQKLYRNRLNRTERTWHWIEHLVCRSLPARRGINAWNRQLWRQATFLQQTSSHYGLFQSYWRIEIVRWRLMLSWTMRALRRTLTLMSPHSFDCKARQRELQWMF